MLGSGACTAQTEYGLYGLGGAAGVGSLGARYMAVKRLAPVAFNFSDLTDLVSKIKPSLAVQPELV